MTTSRWQSPCIAAVVGVFTLSFFLPVCAYLFGPPGACVAGWQACYYGALSVCIERDKGMSALAYSELVIGWSPNLLFLIGVALLVGRRNRSAMIVGIAASFFACIWLLDMRSSLYSGYYVWLASMMLLAVAGGYFAYHASYKRTNGAAAQESPAAFPDPSAFALFNQPRTEQPIPTTALSGAAPSDHPSALVQTPCSPSSST